MTLVEENTVDYSFDGFINWRIIKNNIGSFSTKF